MILVGILAGFIGTLFGLGGGVIMVPFLSIVFDFNIHTAITLSLICILCRSLFSNILFLRENKTNISLGLVLAITAIVGSFIGANVSLITYTIVIKILFACSVFILSLYMLRITQPTLSTNKNSFFFHEYTEKQDTNQKNSHNNSIQYVPIRIKTAVGIASTAGFLGGMLGLGGGSVLVPIMVFICKVPIKIAIATSSFIISFSTVPALLVYTQSIQIDIVTAMLLITGGYIGTYIGKYTLSRIKNKQLSWLFILVNFIISATMVYSALTE